MKQLLPHEWYEIWYHYRAIFSGFPSYPVLRRREILLFAALGTSKQEENAFNYIRELRSEVREKVLEKVRNK